MNSTANVTLDIHGILRKCRNLVKPFQDFLNRYLHVKLFKLRLQKLKLFHRLAQYLRRFLSVEWQIDIIYFSSGLEFHLRKSVYV